MEATEQEALDKPQPLLESWEKTYIETNVTTPMAPVATDSRLGALVVESVVDGQASWEDVFFSQLSEEQLDNVGNVTTKAHAAHKVPFIVEGHIASLKPDQLKQLQEVTKRLLALGIPAETKGYKIDPEIGVGIIPRELFRQGWGFIKDRIYKAVLDYIDALPVEVKPPRQDVINKRGQVFSISRENTDRISNFFAKPENAGYVTALLRMYKAADSILQSPQAKPLSLEQRNRYNLGKGGDPRFRVTESLAKLIDMVDRAVVKEWESISKTVDVPEEAKEKFVDAITRRKDQPTS